MEKEDLSHIVPDYIDRILDRIPPNWRLLNAGLKEYPFMNRSLGLLAVVDKSTDESGTMWITLHLSRKTRSPELTDIKQVRRIFFDERPVIMTLPFEREKTNHIIMYQSQGAEPKHILELGVV